jgi:hypothetical protein
VLHLLALVALAIAQPLYSVLASGADFFVAWGLGFAGAAAAAVALLVVPTVALALAVEAAFAVGPRSGRVALGTAVALLGAATALAPLVRAEVHAALAVPLAAGLGLLLAGLYLRLPLLRSAVSAFSFAPAVMLLLFLASPAIRRLGGAAAAPPEAPAGIEDAAAASRPGVVVVVFDELPLASLLDADLGIDARRLPAFARLAATSTWYRQATTVAEQTTQAIPALLTGIVPRDLRPATAASHPQSLFTLFGRPGRVNVVETLTQVCPEALCGAAPARRWRRGDWRSFARDLALVWAHIVTPPPASSRLPSLAAGWRGFGAGDDDVRSARFDPERSFRAFLDGLPADPRGTLSFVHINLPHLPYQFLPSGRRYGPTSEATHPHGIRGGRQVDNEWESDQALQRHLLQVGFVDRLVGELLDRLRELAATDDTLLVLTADHGVSMRPGFPRRTVSPGTEADILQVPLFVKYPGQVAGAIDDSVVQTIDLLPTIAAALDTRVPWRVDGRDLRSAAPAPPTRTVALLSENKQALRHGELAPRLDAGESARRIARLFPQGDLLALGPFRDWIGSELPAEAPEAAGLGWILEDPWTFAAVDPQSRFLPCQVRGILQPGSRGLPALPLAIAVNGRIRATTWTFERGRGGRAFTAMLPEEIWQPGANRIEIAVFTGPPGAPRLSRIAGGEAATASRTRLDDNWFASDALILPDGARVLIRNGDGLRGFVTVAAEKIYLQGWVADLTTGEPADRLLAFEDGKLILDVSPGDRPAGRNFERADDPAYFRILIPGGLRSNPLDPAVRYFALLRDRAAEVPIFDPDRPVPAGLFRDRFGDDWLSDPPGLVPVLAGAVEGGIRRLETRGADLVITGEVPRLPDRGALRLLLVRVDGTLVVATEVDTTGESVASPPEPSADERRTFVAVAPRSGLSEPVRYFLARGDVALELAPVASVHSPP